MLSRRTLLIILATGAAAAATGALFAFRSRKRRSLPRDSSEFATTVQFKDAAERVRTGKIGHVKQDTQLLLYAYFKQANFGPCTGNRPSLLDPAGQAKYDAWQKLGDMSQSEAAAAYISLVDQLVSTDGEPDAPSSDTGSFGSGFGAKGSTGFDVVDEQFDDKEEQIDMCHWASTGNTLAVINALDQGSDPNYRDEDGIS